MSDVFWNAATPVAAPGDYTRAFLPVRLQGVAPDGSQDQFVQVPLPAAGQNGKSAYQLWLDEGHVGTIDDFLTSLAGTITSSTIAGALGFTPYSDANPNGYLTLDGVRSGLTAASGGGLSYDPTAGAFKLANIAAGKVLGVAAGSGSATPVPVLISDVLGGSPALQNAANTFTAEQTVPALTISTSGDAIRRQRVPTGANSLEDYYINGTLRWRMQVRASDGMMFLTRFNSSGVPQDIPFRVDAGTGLVQMQAAPPSIGTDPITLGFALNGLADQAIVKRPLTAAVARPLNLALNDRAVTPQDHYLATDPDWTSALQKAAATGKDVFLPPLAGGYTLTDRIQITTPGQQIFGDGGGDAYLHVLSTYNMSRNGVVEISTSASEQGTGLSNVRILFDQPSSPTAIGQIIQYPWAIYAPGVSRMHFGGVVRIEAAWNGLYFLGNVGGLSADNLENGAWRQAYAIDGALDTVSINLLRSYPFGVPGSALALWVANNIGGLIGRVDGLDIKTIAHLGSILDLNGYGTNNPSTSFGSIGSIQMDGTGSVLYLGYVNSDPTQVVSIGSYYTTGDDPASPKLATRGGNFQIGNAWVQGQGTGGTVDVIQHNAGYLSIDNLYGRAFGDAQRLFCQNGGTASIRGIISPYSGRNRSAPMFDVVAGRCTADLRFTDAGGATGVAVHVQTDDWHDIRCNSLLGWSRSVPTASSATYQFGSTILGPPL